MTRPDRTTNKEACDRLVLRAYDFFALGALPRRGETRDDAVAEIAERLKELRCV